MSKTAWPTEADLKTFLSAGGLIENPPTGDAIFLGYADAAASALDCFEAQTGYKPFMAASADTTRYYTPDGTGIVDLKGGIVTLTSLTTGVSTTSTGTAQTVNEDFYLKPDDASERSLPYTWVQMATRLWGAPRSLKIIGRFGYCANAAIPERAWQCVLRMAAMEIMPQVQQLLNRQGLKRLTQGDVTREWAGLEEQVRGWDRFTRQVIGEYRRPLL